MKKIIIYILAITLILLVAYSLFFGKHKEADMSYKVVSNNESIIPNHNFVNKTDTFPAPKQKCLTCHNGVEPIREHDSEMAKQIYDLGKQQGDPNGCVVCHKGNPNELTNKSLAHGKHFIKYPGSVWTYEETCGKCHEDHTYSLHRNLMQTEAGKIQGALWGWGGALEGINAIYGNYNIDDPDGKTPRIGSERYKEYMHNLAKEYPNNFPDSLIQLPEANVDSIKEHPEQAVLTYLRTECLRCHVGVRGKQRRGDFRGMGCASCHIPFSDNGFYEGSDKMINKKLPGHSLVHSIQSSRKTKVKVHDKTYSGIPSETCSTCHNRGKRVGVSFLGMMETPYTTNWNDDGSTQTKLHGKRYHFIQDDAHHSKKSRKGNPSGGLMCQDCHTTISVHGNGNIGGTTLGEIETECADCHGTPEKYPWELPIGYGDEFGMKLSNKPRGLTSELLDVQKKFSTVYPVEDGYLLTSRGNPYGNVVKKDSNVIVHSASGLDFKVPVLKKMTADNSWEHPEKAVTAMVNIGKHIDKMECYSCHSTWAPQCYGCHVKVDYSKQLTATDWIKTGNAHFSNGETCETAQNEDYKKTKGKVTESRSYTRWEDPILGINGEGRVTPLIPGCQQITTVIGEDGKSIINNKIWRTPPNTENGGKMGQRGIDMSPVQPHTVTKEARDCASCHTNQKTLGYGINDGKYLLKNDSNRYADLRNAEGELLSDSSTIQFNAIEDLPMDLSQIVTRDGKQLQTVGHHWNLSSPLTQDQREKMERVGVCISCHKDLPDGDLSLKAISTAGNMLDMIPHTDTEHSNLLNKTIKLSAIVQVVMPIIIFALILIFYLRRRKKRKIS